MKGLKCRDLRVFSNFSKCAGVKKLTNIMSAQHIKGMVEIQQFRLMKGLYILHTWKIHRQVECVKREIEWRILKADDSGFMLTRTSGRDWKSVVTPIVVTGKLDIANKGSDLWLLVLDITYNTTWDKFPLNSNADGNMSHISQSIQWHGVTSIFVQFQI